MQETLILEVESLPHLLLVTSNVTVYVKLVQQCRGNMSRFEGSSFIHLLLAQRQFTVKVTLLLLVIRRVIMSVMLGDSLSHQLLLFTKSGVTDWVTTTRLGRENLSRLTGDGFAHILLLGR